MNTSKTAPAIAGLSVYEYTGEGYNRTMHYGEWRVAILNRCDKFDPTYPMPPERHFLTDEVFVLLGGRAVLEIWPEGAGTRLSVPVTLESGKLYSVGAGVYHRVSVSPDGKLLIVENHNTGLDNSEYMTGFPTKEECGVAL